MAKFKLITVLTVATDREEKARQELEKKVAEQAQADAQLQQLMAYRDDYQNRQRSGKPMSPFEWQGYQDFLIRIQQAIDIQTHICDKAKKTSEAAKEHFFKQRRFLKGIEHLKDKHEKSEEKRLEKVEQKLLDEFSMTRFRLKE
ncbi:MAG: flagellar export protein FliJ [Pseudomonadota bacterium]